MFGKLFLKEWKEKISLFIFPFIGMLIFVVVILAYPSQKFEVIEYLSWAMFLFFLPFTGLMLGASGFQSEFKDGAWAYLFSRPIKKWKIWVIKYFSQITILLFILLIFRLIIFILPVLKEAMKTDVFSINTLESTSFFYTCLLLSLSAFTISFSISFLYEKQFIILFVSILIGSGLAFVSYKYFAFLEPDLYEVRLEGFYIFIALSFVAASILAFIKSDFSQVGKRIWLFSKFVFLFLVISFSIGTIWTLKSQDEYLYFSDGYFNEYKGDVYFDTDKGIFRYVPEADKVEKIIKSYLGLRLARYELYSVRGEKIAFNKYDRKYENQELWIMNTDGSQKKSLLQADNVKDSPLYDSWLSTCILSHDGKKVGFITVIFGEGINEYKYTLWWMNLDGAGLKSKVLDFPNASDFQLIVWPEFGNSMIIQLRDWYYGDLKIVKFNLDSKTHQFLTEKPGLPLEARMPLNHGLFAFCSHSDKDGKQTLSVLDLRTLEKKDIYEADSIDGIEWSKNGDKIAFLTEGNNLMVYNLLENSIKKIKEINYAGSSWDAPDFDFVLNDKKIVVCEKINGEFYLRLFGEGFIEEKQLKIPFHLEYGKPYIKGLNNIIMVINPEKNELWRVNLDTEEWRKIYH